MRRLPWEIRFGVLLVGLSAALYGVHYLIFSDPHHIFIYLLGDVAFVPVEVLLVTLVIHRVLERHERQARLRKMHMAIGTFFSEIGNPLLRRLRDLDPEADKLSHSLRITEDWSAADYHAARARFREDGPPLAPEPRHLEDLRAFLVERRAFLLALLGNPNLLEHETFTNLLWAVFHLADELAHRGAFADLPQTDREHLVGDLRRVYGRLIAQWLRHMEHLQATYPYLFSLSLRTNPFNPQANAVVTG